MKCKHCGKEIEGLTEEDYEILEYNLILEIQ